MVLFWGLLLQSQKQKEAEGKLRHDLRLNLLAGWQEMFEEPGGGFHRVGRSPLKLKQACPYIRTISKVFMLWL